MKVEKLMKLEELDKAIVICNRAAERVQTAMTKREPLLTKEFTKLHAQIQVCNRSIQNHREIMADQFPLTDTTIGSVADNISRLEMQLKEYEARYSVLLKKLSTQFEDINNFKTELEEKRNLISQATTEEVIEQATVEWPTWRRSNTVKESQSMEEIWGRMALDHKIFVYYEEISVVITKERDVTPRGPGST